MLAICVLAVQGQMQAGVTTSATIPLTMSGAAQQAGALNSAMTSGVASAVQGAVRSMPGAQVANAIQGAAATLPGAAPVTSALQSAVNGVAVSS
jgi:hypothetical protein